MVAVETEANGDSRSTTYERGPFFVGFWVWRAGTREFCSTLAALVGPVQNIFFPHRTVHYFNAFVPIAQQAGQAAVLGRLSLCTTVVVFKCEGLRLNAGAS
jgi:hypothetical protein